MISWFARNPVAANILMFAIVIAGLLSAATQIPVETFPIRESDQVTVSTTFRGATPASVEDGITLRIEEAIADIEGIEDHARLKVPLPSLPKSLKAMMGVRY